MDGFDISVGWIFGGLGSFLWQMLMLDSWFGGLSPKSRASNLLQFEQKSGTTCLVMQ